MNWTERSIPSSGSLSSHGISLIARISQNSKEAFDGGATFLPFGDLQRLVNATKLTACFIGLHDFS
jgi:hypothetical protein